jgi:hypothetical protein
VDAAKRACGSAVGEPRAAIVAGSGEFLADRVAQQAIAPGGSILSLSKSWGTIASSAGCAFALLTLAVEREGELGASP